jgi:hypothetical protein
MSDFHISLESEQLLANFEIGIPGPTGPTGPAGPNSVTSATTSDGTASLDILDLTVGGDGIVLTGANGFICTEGMNGQIFTNGSDATIYTLGSDATISTNGVDARIYTQGAGAHIHTIGQFGSIYTAGENATIYTSGDYGDIYTTGSDANIYTQGEFSEIYTTGDAADIFTGGANANIRTSNGGYIQTSSTFKITDVNGVYATTLSGTQTANRAIAFPDADGTVALTTSNVATATALATSRDIFGQSFNGTGNVNGNLLTNGHLASVPSGGEAGHLVTLNGTSPTVVTGRSAWWSNASGVPSFRNGTGSAVTLIRSTDLGTNVATFLATPSSANLAACLTDETGTGANVFADSPTLTSPTINSGISGTAVPSVLQNQAGSTRPICVLFEDFYGLSGAGTHPWNDSGTGSTDASATGGAGQFIGTCRLVTGTTQGNSRSRSLGIGASNIFIGAIIRYGFAIPDITTVNLGLGFSGGGSACQLVYQSASNSGQWVLSTNAGISTFTAATPQAGNYFSGKRYQVEIERVSATQTRILLEIADFNLANWSTVYAGTVTHTSVSGNWGESTPSFYVQTQAVGASRTIMVDWCSLFLPIILR